MTDVLSDQDSRDRIRNAFDVALFVEAGAGTGKTTELVQRVVGIVEAGRARLGEIVAITFTEAAAGELRERVRSQLEARAAVASGPTLHNLSAAIEEVDSAPMQTIHAFANRLLQMFPTEVGLPPVFDVRDATESSLAFDAHWRGVARRMFVASSGDSESKDPRDAQEHLLQLAWAMGADLRKLRELARSFHEHADRLESVSDPGAAPDWLHLLDGVIAKADVIAGLQFHCKSEDDKLCKAICDVVIPWRDSLIAARERADEIAAVEALALELPKLGRVGNSSNWPREVITEVRALCGELEAARLEALRVPRAWVMDGLVHVFGTLAVEAQQKRVREGTLEFGDLLVLADRLVMRPEVRTQLQEQFKFVFVDEFQDTDPIQARLVQHLVTPVKGGDSRLFTVGDPKQSIYRFRNADLNQYLSMRSMYSHAVAKLETNFRTLSGILKWVDAVFEPLMTRSLGSWNPLAHGRKGKHIGTVQVFGGVADEGVLSARVREIETDELAQRLNDARDQGWLVHDKSASDGVRPIRFGDMAVLLPTRRSLANLERSFRQANIPYRVESRSLLWSTQEIRDVVSILRAIDDPSDENAVVAALRSPAFGCGDDDLARWRINGGSWNYSNADASQSANPVAVSMGVLRSLRERSRFLDVPGIVNLVIDDRRLFQSAFGHIRQREPWNRLRFIADQAQAWFDEGGSSLHSFIAWAVENEELQASLLESVVPESDDDAVRVMTIHAAKGLEFPLTAVVGLGSVPNVTDSVRVLWPEGSNKPEVRIGNVNVKWQTASFDAAAEADAHAEHEERLRLLYVAVTRARDHLLVGLHRTAKERKPYSLASLLAEALDGVDVSHIPAQPQCAPRAASQVERDVNLEAEAVARQLAEASVERDSLIAKATRNVLFSATSIRQRVAGALEVLPTQTAGHSQGDDLGKKLHFGSAVHKTLEEVPFDASIDEVKKVAAFSAAEFEVEECVDEIVQSVRKAHASWPVQQAKSARSWREVNVARDVDGVVVRGSIDLLYEREDGLVVVDYKTEAVPTSQELEHAVDSYRYQLYSYAAALQQDGVGDVVEVVLLFIPPGAGDAVVVSEPAAQSVDALRRVLAGELFT